MNQFGSANNGEGTVVAFQMRKKSKKSKDKDAGDKTEIGNANATETVTEDDTVEPRVEFSTWHRSKQPTKADLYQRIQHMIDKNINPDVLVTIGEHKFECHSVVLAIYSDLFTSLKYRHALHFPEEKVSPKAFDKIYKWMIADETEISREDLLIVFNAAHYLGVRTLIQQLWDVFDDIDRFSENKAFELYMEAQPYNEGQHMRSLKQLMISRIYKFFIYLVSTKEFLNLGFNEVIQFLSSNSLGVNSETEIFMTAARWLDYDWQTREPLAEELMRYVRFNLMPSWYLIDLVRMHQSSKISRLTEKPIIHQMIEDGITYSTMLLCCNYSQQEFAHVLARYNLERPMKRQWIMDIGCSYHATTDYPQTPSITYKLFSDYMKNLQQKDKNYWHSFLAISKSFSEEKRKLELIKLLPNN